MARLLIQSRASGRFLVPSDEDGQPTWIVPLRLVGSGVFEEPERAAQLLQDWTEPEDLAQVIDLDKLGTPNDYT